MIQRFSDILDQQGAIDALQRAWQAEHLPHGLLFAGPTGVGKSSTASALGALFLCRQPVQMDSERGTLREACGKCESCRLIDSATHPDYHLITRDLIRYHDKTGKSKGIELSINVLRPELIEAANRKSSLGGGKVFIVKEADLMNVPAQNAILKTLEEPAGRTLIVLLADQPGLLLATIRSRCQLVRFGVLPESVVLAELQRRGVDARTASDAARLADGSLGLALKWIEDQVIEPGRELVSRLNAGRGGDLAAWFKSAAEAYAARQIERDELASKDQATREGLGVFLRIASGHFRGRLRDAAGADAGGEADRSAHFPALYANCSAIDAIVRAEMYLDSNVNVPIVLQQLALHLSGPEGH